VEDAISILLMDLTDESREGGAIKGVPTNPKLVDDSIQSGPWFFGFENQWVAMQIAAAADGKLIVDTADSSLVCNLTTLKTSKDEGAHLWKITKLSVYSFWGYATADGLGLYSSFEYQSMHAG